MAVRSRAYTTGKIARPSLVTLAPLGSAGADAASSMVTSAGPEIISPAIRPPTPTLTRASVDKLKKEISRLQEELPELRAENKRLSSELEESRQIQAAQLEEIDSLRAELERLRNVQLQEADALHAEQERLQLLLHEEKRTGSKELDKAQTVIEEEQRLRCAAMEEAFRMRKQWEASREKPCEDCDDMRKQLEAAQADRNVAVAAVGQQQRLEGALKQSQQDLDQQREQFEEDMKAMMVKFQKIRASYGADSVRKRLVVHIVAPSIWLESHGAPAWLLPGGPGVGTLQRALESDLLPLCADVLCYEEDDAEAVNAAKERADSLVTELTVGLQKHLMEHGRARLAAGVGSAFVEEVPAARVRVDWNQLPPS